MVVAPAARGFAFSHADCNGRGIPVGIDIDAIFSGALQGESQIRRVNFKIVASIQPAHIDVHRTLRQLNLYGAVIEVQERNSRIFANTNGRAINVEFAAGIFIRPKVVACSERAVGIRLHPFRFPTGLKGNGSLNVVQASYSSRRIVVSQRGRREAKEKSSKKNQKRKKNNSSSHGDLSSDKRSLNRKGLYF